MTREEEILSAARQYNNGIIFSNPSNVLHFEAGAKWADEHPVNVFHDASEEPKDRSHILIYYKYMGDMEFKSYHLNYQCDFKWSELVNIFEVECWTYISDLFPKGGKKLKD